MSSPFGTGGTGLARALLLGDRITPQVPEDWQVIARIPLLLAAPSGGRAAIFRYGVVVLFDLTPEEQQGLLNRLAIREPLEEPESEEVEIRLEPGAPESVEAGVVHAPDVSPARLQVIAVALAKSVILDHYEHVIAQSFDLVEPLARGLDRGQRRRRLAGELLSQIGETLLAEQRMAGRVEVREKPDVLWDEPDLERFYARLETEYELRERAGALDRKLELISRTARTSLEVLQAGRALRVEWYIVILIVAEIVLLIFEMWWA